MEERGEARFDVHHAVAVHVLHHFVGDAFEGLCGLHHATRVREPFEIHRQAAALSAAVKPPREIARVGGWQAFVTLLLREVDDGLRPQAPVEMVVQEHLGQGSNQRGVHLHRGSPATHGAPGVDSLTSHSAGWFTSDSVASPGPQTLPARVSTDCSRTKRRLSTRWSEWSLNRTAGSRPPARTCGSWSRARTRSQP